MKNIEDEKQIQNVVIEILQDCIEEDKKIIKRLQGIIVLLILLLFGSFVFYVWYLNQYDFEDVVTTTTEAITDNNSNINNSDNANAQNNININR